MARTLAVSAARRHRAPAAEAVQRCACGGRLESRVIHRYRYQDEYGREIEVHNVPAQVCRRCGDAVLPPAVIASIAERISRSLFVPRHLNLAR